MFSSIGGSMVQARVRKARLAVELLVSATGINVTSGNVKLTQDYQDLLQKISTKY